MALNLAVLIEALGHEDGVYRDQVGFGLLARWIGRGRLDEERSMMLGDTVAQWFMPGHSIQQRAFAPLILAHLAIRLVHRDEWARQFSQWWVSETDTTGLDERLGWLHIVAHGADHELVDSDTLLDWWPT